MPPKKAFTKKNVPEKNKRAKFTRPDVIAEPASHVVVARKVTTTPHINGTSDATYREAQIKAKERNEALLKSGAHFVELAIGYSQTAPFEYVEVPADEILVKTAVFKGNARFQSTLNQYSLFDIYSSIQTDGQTYPAVGYFDESGKIITVEGSRRRWTCHLTNKPFKILVTPKILTMKNALYLSKISHAKQELSLFEKGATYQQLLDDGICATAADVATLMDTSEPSVTYARQAFNMPNYLIDNIPSINTLGRPSIKKLTDALTLAAQANEESDLKQYIEALTLKALQAEVLQTGDKETLFKIGNKLNKKFVSDIVKYAKSLGKSVHKNKKKIIRRKSVATNGELKCFISATSKGFDLVTENLTEEKKAAILAAVKEIIEQ